MPLDAEALENALRSLAQKVIVEVDAWKASGALVLRRDQYTLRPDFSLWYDPDPTIMNVELQTFEEEDWHWKDVEAFLTDRVVILREHADVIRLIQEGGQNEGLVRSFVGRIAYEVGKTGSSNVGQHVATFLRDATDSPQTYNIKLFLTGITLSESTIRISDWRDVARRIYRHQTIHAREPPSEMLLRRNVTWSGLPSVKQI